MISMPAFWDELQKISQEIPQEDRPMMDGPPQTIKPGMIGRLVRYGLPTAAAIGVGYGTSRLVGRPLERWLLSRGVGPRAATFLRYAVPTSMALGAGYSMAGNKLMRELSKKVVGDDVQRQNPAQ